MIGLGVFVLESQLRAASHEYATLELNPEP